MDPRLSAGYITIDLVAIQKNYQKLLSLMEANDCAAVVKADAYGLGAQMVAPALHDAGCQKFFVAIPEEGVALRRILPDVEIFILGGLFPDCEEVYVHERLAPVLNSLEEIETWSKLTQSHGPLPAIIHIDSGICRLGLLEADVNALAANPGIMDGIEVEYLMSHLASADDFKNPQNQEQLDTLTGLIAKLPEGLRNTPVSFANSSGMFHGTDFRFELGRPGIALYGANPTPHLENPMLPVVEWQGKVLQVHDVDSGKPVGYGATYRTSKRSRIATVSIGYADGYFRYLGNKAEVSINNKRVPVVGRVSMDMITIDITSLDEGECERGDLVYLIGESVTLDYIAEKAGTVAYEILTSLGQRCHRRYLDAGA
ncbi:alanine racemase [Sneathiella limimaris]|uniref:alanine racemase n=1 Tax=Sneathiella limimaris TaxID=1964213 RepID=UPI00146C0906|nr:alanine racemase [Sneathiella limimaris]